MCLLPLECASGFVASGDHIARNILLAVSERMAASGTPPLYKDFSFTLIFTLLPGPARFHPKGRSSKNQLPTSFPRISTIACDTVQAKALLDLTCKDPATESEIKPYRPSFNAGKKHASFVSGAIYELASDGHPIINVSEKTLR
jgi:hypothetical protein